MKNILLLLLSCVCFGISAHSPENPLICQLLRSYRLNLQKNNLEEIIEESNYEEDEAATYIHCDGTSFVVFVDEPVNMQVVWDLEISKIDLLYQNEAENKLIYKINFADRRDYLVITENIIAPGVIRINRVLPDENIPEYLQTVSVMDCRYL